MHQSSGLQGSHHARFRHRSERIVRRLGTRMALCNSLSEAKRPVLDLRIDLNRTEHKSSRKTLSQIIEE